MNKEILSDYSEHVFKILSEYKEVNLRGALIYNADKSCDISTIEYFNNRIRPKLEDRYNIHYHITYGYRLIRNQDNFYPKMMCEIMFLMDGNHEIMKHIFMSSFPLGSNTPFLRSIKKSFKYLKVIKNMSMEEYLMWKMSV